MSACYFRVVSSSSSSSECVYPLSSGVYILSEVNSRSMEAQSGE